ncbi:MAG: methionyl-tRNA formyltransferase [Prochloron sp. SP5CPC1]|nr:methionyl-tRNA formyltransferase [Candidatus Paraprochloron terpiosi SP5CPC1]
MKIVFFGTPQFTVPSLKRLLKEPEFEVIAVVTQPDKPRGRGKKLIPTPVKTVALEHQLPVWQPQSIKKDRETFQLLEQSRADAFIVVAYGQIFPPKILALPKLGCINLHGSILPQYRGAAPIQWSLYNGDRTTGITTMVMDKGMDTGAMLLKTDTPVGLLENAQEVGTKLATMGADLIVETLLKLNQGVIEPIAQDSSIATYANLIKKSDYALDLSRSALELHNQIRGFYPNCQALLGSQKLKILATAPVGDPYFSQLPPELNLLEQQWDNLSALGGSPGEIVSIIKNIGPILQTGEGLLLLREVQLAGKRPQSGWDFVNGMHLKVGEIIKNG